MAAKRPKTPSSEDAALDAVEARVDGLAARVEQLESDSRDVRAELARRGIVGPVINPGRRKAKLSPEQRQAILIQTAARARAAKAVGTGKGAVRSTKTKKKLESDARGRRRS